MNKDDVELIKGGPRKGPHRRRGGGEETAREARKRSLESQDVSPGGVNTRAGVGCLAIVFSLGPTGNDADGAP